MKTFKKRRVIAIITAISMAVSMITVSVASSISDDDIYADFSQHGINDTKLAEMIADGTIPADTTDLWLSDNSITDLTPLISLENLYRVNLRGNQISDLTPLVEMPSLTILNLAHNEIDDLSPLAEMPQLERLYLDYNKVSDLEPLADLINLFALSLSFNQITDISHLAGLINLGGEFGVLDLSSNQIIDISPLKQLTQLQYLGLFNNKITDITPLENMPDLIIRQVGFDTLPLPDPDKQVAELRAELREKQRIRDLPPREIGNITGPNGVTISDALEILMFLAGMETVLCETSNPPSWKAALITPESKAQNEPSILDALHILMKLAGLDNYIDNPPAE
jgi:hypothetical protein